MKIVVAPNAFKHAVTADDATTAIVEGLRKSNLQSELIGFPVGDGGDGTGRLLIQHLNYQTITCKATDPLGREIETEYGFDSSSRTAVIEMAQASGLKLLKPEERNPMIASSAGTGALMQDAIGRGASRILLCVGGSASVDGGIGILFTLGFILRDDEGNEIPPFAINLSRISSIERPPRGQCEIIILCDVTNPLVGKNGAAEVFGPQKGADRDQVTTLDKGLANLASVIRNISGVDVAGLQSAGAAGGVAGVLHGMLDAKLVTGIEYFLDVTNFNDLIKDCDVLITGEGSLDEQTLSGKAPIGVAKRAKEAGARVVGVAGTIAAVPALAAYFDEMICINTDEKTLPEKLRATRQNLIRVGEELGQRMKRERLL